MSLWNKQQAIEKAKHLVNELVKIDEEGRKYNSFIEKEKVFSMCGHLKYIDEKGHTQTPTQKFAEKYNQGIIPEFWGECMEEEILLRKDWETYGNEHLYLNTYPRTNIRLKYDIINWCNTFDESKIKVTLDYLRRLASEHQDKDILIEVLARITQTPKERTPVVVLMSVQGTGKSTLFELIKMIFGDCYGTITQTNLASNFNNWILKPIVCTEEATDTRKVNNIIKYISGSTAKLVELKGKDTKNIDITNHLFINTNNEVNPVKVEKSDRRFLIMTPPPLEAEKRDPTLLKKLKEESKDFFYFLATYPIEYRLTGHSDMGFTNEELETPSKLKIMGNNNEIKDNAEDYMNNLCYQFGVEECVFQASDLAKNFNCSIAEIVEVFASHGILKKTHKKPVCRNGLIDQSEATKRTPTSGFLWKRQKAQVEIEDEVPF